MNMSYDLVTDKLHEVNSIVKDLNKNNANQIFNKLHSLHADLFRNNDITPDEYFAITTYINGIRAGIVLGSLLN